MNLSDGLEYSHAKRTLSYLFMGCLAYALILQDALDIIFHK